jgi:glycosyltransferase involved in cell wall biosynthesis
VSESRDDGTLAQVGIGDADAVIACSQAVAEYITGCRPEVIYAGVEMDGEPPPAPAATDTLRIGILGRLIPLKNVEAVLEATAVLAGKGIEVEVEIAGSGPSEPHLRELVRSLGVHDRVQFLGWRADASRLLSSWDFLAIPSLDEGFPVSVLEAMAAARPVVGSRVGGLCEQVVDGVTGRLVAPGDKDAFTRCIAELASQREHLALMGVEGWKRAKEHFSLDGMARKTTELYDELLKRRTYRPS